MSSDNVDVKHTESAAPLRSPGSGQAGDGAGAPTPLPPAVTHYENFPVASWLCPAPLRAPIAAIYHFARSADDLADEGDATAQERLQALGSLRQALDDQLQGRPVMPRWASLLAPLGEAVNRHALPHGLFTDLLDAFEQDIRRTDAGQGYADLADLLDYCRRSANPVGRLLLHLYGVRDERALEASDAICTALQLINFWQDLSVDLSRGRFYLPQDRCAALGIDPRQPASAEKASLLIAEYDLFTLGMMQKGQNLVHQVPGRAGWELRLVVQGGLRVLEKVRRLGPGVLARRPRLHWWDAPLLVWRALWM
jgi:squalene synthase HpnC